MHDAGIVRNVDTADLDDLGWGREAGSLEINNSEKWHTFEQ